MIKIPIKKVFTYFLRKSTETLQNEFEKSALYANAMFRVMFQSRRESQLQTFVDTRAQCSFSVLEQITRTKKATLSQVEVIIV